MHGATLAEEALLWSGLEVAKDSDARLCYADVHCYAFSPPGGMVNRGLSSFMEPFVTSMAVGKDMVPRMSMPNLARMIDQMVRYLALLSPPSSPNTLLIPPVHVC